MARHEEAATAASPAAGTHRQTPRRLGSLPGPGGGCQEHALPCRPAKHFISQYAGIVGAYVARAFLEAGATVVAPARSQASQVKIEADLGAVAPGKLHVPLADVGSVEGALELGKFVEESGLGPVDHVVSSTGGEHRGQASSG